MKLLFLTAILFLAATSQAQLVIKEAWNKSIKGKDAIYGCEAGVQKPKLIAMAMWESPLPTTLAPRMLDLAVEFTSEEAKKIAADCKAQKKEVFEQIGCVSLTIQKHFDGRKFTGLNSFCRTHAYAFNKTFAELNIPRSSSDTYALAGGFGDTCNEGKHVANRVVLVSERGQPYTYIIDSGWFPGQAFPLSQNTVDYHATNSSAPKLADKADCASAKLPQSGLLELWSKIKAD